jgi:hypothetical protein
MVGILLQAGDVTFRVIDDSIHVIQEVNYFLVQVMIIALRIKNFNVRTSLKFNSSYCS